jgi:hypothetical protein
VAADFSNITVAIYGYQDRCKSYPATMTLLTVAGPASGRKGNGMAPLTMEVSRHPELRCSQRLRKCKLWQHLRLRFVAGDPSSKIAPQNSAGGFLQYRTAP